jgi:peptidoglycan hydrolase CwlO-like protein
MLNRHLILSTLIIGLLVGMVGSIYDSDFMVFAQQEKQDRKAQWEEYRIALATVELMDRELRHVNDKFGEIKTNIKEINQKIDKISDDITGVKIRVAGYGGAASIIVYLLGLLVQGLWNKKKNGK